MFRSEHLPAKPSNVVVPNYVPAATPQRQAPLMMPTPVSATTPPIMHAPTAAAPKTRTPVSASVPGHSSVMSGVPFGPPAVEAAPILHMHMAENGRAKSVSAQSNGTATPAPSATTSSPEATSWAQVGNKGKPNGQNYSIAPAPKKERPYILLNAFDQRLDIPVSKAKSNFEGLDARVKRSGKVCNVFHINGKCYDPYCEYDHDPRLGEAERTALRIKARQRSCALMLNCMDPYCINGHQCVYGPNCAYGDDCFFAETHHMDR